MEWVGESRLAKASLSQSLSVTDVFVSLWRDEFGLCEKWGFEHTHTHKVKHFLESNLRFTWLCLCTLSNGIPVDIE